MKHLKISGLAAMATAVLMAIAGSASATSLTSAPGTTYTGPIHIVHTQSAEVALHGTVENRCPTSTIEWEVESHGAAVTTQGPVTAFTLSQCSGSTTIAFRKLGSFELHAITPGGEGNATVTWNGAEITFLTHSLFGQIHCIYEAEGTDIGLLKSSNATGATAKLLVEASLPLKEGNFLCSESLGWTGEYIVTIPDYLVAD